MTTRQQEINNIKDDIKDLIALIHRCERLRNLDYLNTRLQELRQTLEDLRNREKAILPED